MAALIRKRNVCRFEVRANDFHRRHPFGEHQVFRLQFSGGFHFLQFLNQFGMQRTRLFLAILGENGG